MPDWFSKLFKKEGRSTDSVEEECPLKKKGSICVAVSKPDTAAAIAGVSVTVSGPQTQTKPTTPQGVAEFVDLTLGAYEVTVSPPQNLSSYNYNDDKRFEARVVGGVFLGADDNFAMVEVFAYPAGTPKVKVAKKGDAPVPISGATVSIEGPRGALSATTQGGTGIADFGPRKPGKYSVKGVTLGSEDQKDYQLANDLTQNPVEFNVAEGQVGQGEVEVVSINTVEPKIETDAQEAPVKFEPAKAVTEEIHLFQAKAEDEPQAKLVAVTLSIQQSEPERAYEKDAVLTLTGAKVTLWSDDQCKNSLDVTGGQLTIPNSKLKEGYTIYLRGEELGDAKLELTLEESATRGVKLAATTASSTVSIKATNRVTPYIRVEHLVVLHDQELWREQRKNDTLAGSNAIEEAKRIYPDATRLELSAAKLKDEPTYTGKGQLSLTPANVTLYQEETCENVFDPATKIDFDKLSGDEPFKLWMRGKTAGKFKAKLTLDPSNDDLILVDKPAEGELGCVELKMKLHHYKKDDVNKAIEPDVAEATTLWDQMKGLTLEQKEMTKAERAGVGRMLHVQRDKKNARAKLIVEKITEAQWPEKAKTYKILVDLADGDKKGKTRSGALKLFSAETEGTEKTPLPQKLDFDTIKGAEQTYWIEGATACTALRGIRVSLGFDRDDGGPAKEKKMDGDWGAFTVINIKEVKCDVANEAGQEKFVEGDKIFINVDADARLLKSVGGKRKAEVTATIEPAIENVDLYFQIVEHKDNYAIAKLPDHFKEKKISHLKQSVKPSDRDDPKKLLHMSAKTDSSGKAKIETLKTSQFGKHKFKIAAYILQDPNHARFIHEHADLKKYEPVMSDTWLEVWRRIFYRVAAMKRWSGASYLDRFDEGALQNQMAAAGIKLESSLPAVEKDFEIAQPHVLNWAKAALGGAAPARTMYLCLINGRGDKADEELTFNLGKPQVKIPAWNLPYRRFRDPTNRATWLVHCKLTYGVSTIDIDGLVNLVQSEDFKFQLTIDLNPLWTQVKDNSDEATANDMLANATIELKYKQALSSSGVSWGEAVVVCMDTREPNHPGTDAKDSASHTFLHEIGHYIGLASKFQPDTANTLNPNFYSERGGETSQAGFGGVGVGPHCDGLANDCIVWYQFKMTLEYCNMCKLFMHARDLSSPKVDARSNL